MKTKGIVTSIRKLSNAALVGNSGIQLASDVRSPQTCGLRVPILRPEAKGKKRCEACMFEFALCLLLTLIAF